MLSNYTFIRFVAILLILGKSFLAIAQPNTDGSETGKIDADAYPVPAENPDMLFYLQRSLDLNSVVYAAKFDKEDSSHRKLDGDEPVNIYWQINDKIKSTKPLSKIQKLGYGIRSEYSGGEIQIKLVAYRDMPIFLRHSLRDDRYHAHVSMNGKDVLLTKVFVNIDGGTKLKPNVTYIEITGTETQTGKKAVHRIKP